MWKQGAEGNTTKELTVYRSTYRIKHIMIMKRHTERDSKREKKKYALIVVVHIVSLYATAFIYLFPNRSFDLRSATQIIIEFLYCIDISFIANDSHKLFLDIIVVAISIYILTLVSNAEYAMLFM